MAPERDRASPQLTRETPGASVASSLRGASVLVWARDRTGELATYALSGDEERDARIVARHEGVLWSIGGSLWRWEQRKSSVPLIDCRDPLSSDPDTAPVTISGRGHAIRGVAQRLGDEREVVVVEPVDDELVAELEHTVTLLGSFGPYVIARDDADFYACGAHGSTHSRFHVVDLRTGRPVALLAAAKRQGLERQREAAHEALDAAHAAPMRDVRLTAALPRFEDGRLQLGYLFSAETCYACGDGRWNSYTVSTAVPASRLPAFLQPFADAPEPIRQFAREHPELSIGGWSEMPQSVARDTRPSDPQAS